MFAEILTEKMQKLPNTIENQQIYASNPPRFLRFQQHTNEIKHNYYIHLTDFNRTTTQFNIFLHNINTKSSNLITNVFMIIFPFVISLRSRKTKWQMPPYYQHSPYEICLITPETEDQKPHKYLIPSIEAASDLKLNYF